MRKHHKLTEVQREEAVQMYLMTDKTLQEISELFGVSKQNIHNLVRSRRGNEDSQEIKREVKKELKKQKKKEQTEEQI